MRLTPLPSAVLALIFVLLWGSGGNFGKLGLEYTGPLTFLTLRFLCAAVPLLVLALALRVPWPSSWRALYHACTAGFLLHFCYVTGCFFALAQGVTPGLLATILGIQPMLTALICHFFFKDTIRPIQWIGLSLGFLGILLVTLNTLEVGALPLRGLDYLIFGLIGITLGTLYQKKYCQNGNTLSYCTIQYFLCGLLSLGFAIWKEHLVIHWSAPLVISVAWMSLLVSVGAVSILYFLIQKGDATRVSSVFYLVPPYSAVVDYLAFGDKLSHMTLMGMFVISLGILFVNNIAPQPTTTAVLEKS